MCRVSGYNGTSRVEFLSNLENLGTMTSKMLLRMASEYGS